MSVFVVRAFLRLREWVVNGAEVASRLAVLEKRVGGHDRSLNAVIAAIRQLVVPSAPARRRIGFAPPWTPGLLPPAPPRSTKAGAKRATR